MCKFKCHILVFLIILGTISGTMNAEPTIAIVPTADALCTSNPFISFLIDFQDDGSFGTTNSYIFEYSEDGVNWTRFITTNRRAYGYSQRPKNLKEGWYRVSAARQTEVDQPDKWLVSEAVYMEKIEGGCTPFRHPWQDELSDDVCPRGTILFREDFGGNDPSDPLTCQEQLTTMSTKYKQAFDVISTVHSGLFTVAKHGWQNNLSYSTTADQSSQWFIQDDHTYPNDYTRGYLLEVDGIGGNDAFYTTTFPVCHELDLSFSAYVANVLTPGHQFSRPKVRFLIQDELTNDTIWEQATGEIEPAPADYMQYGHEMNMSAPWHLVGASFHVPQGVSLIRLSIFNDVNSGLGNDFAMDDIEIRLCKPEVTILSEHEICADSSYVFEASVTADGGFREPYNYLWQYAPDSLPFNSDGWSNVVFGETLSFDSVKLSDDGWYRLCVTSNGIDVETEPYCRALSEPFHLSVQECIPCPELQTMTIDTTVCDTLMPFTWRDTLFTAPGSFSVLHKDRRDCDSLLCVYTLHTGHCCPELQTMTIDTTVCDTLMPFTWRDTLFAAPGSFSVLYRDRRDCDSLLCVYNLHTEVCCYPLKSVEIDTIVCDTLMPFTWHGLVFNIPSGQLVMEQSPRGCDSIVYVYALDTMHCERLYSLIVNKYNWQLLCDNVELCRLFPEQNATAFQWYKNEEPVFGATQDDYSEENELHGTFQLRVTLGERVVWSKIVELLDFNEEIPVQVQIFNSNGEQVEEEQIGHGIYLYRFEQGSSVWTEKRLIL